MHQQSPTPERVQAVLGWCSQAYLRHGHALKFPERTDPKKTYNWRYLTAIAKKFDEWEFDDATAEKFVNIAVDYAAERKLASKGLAVLHQANLLAECYKRLKLAADDSNHYLAALEADVAWLRRNDLCTVSKLLRRKNLDSYSALTDAYLRGKLSDITFALSKACYFASIELSKIDPVEHRMLPKYTDLYLLRKKFCKEHDVVRAKEILGNDWRNHESRDRNGI